MLHQMCEAVPMLSGSGWSERGAGAVEGPLLLVPTGRNGQLDKRAGFHRLWRRQMDAAVQEFGVGGVRISGQFRDLHDTTAITPQRSSAVRGAGDSDISDPHGLADPQRLIAAMAELRGSARKDRQSQQARDLVER